MRKFKSLWVYHVDAGSCNGCDIEVLDVLTPYYDLERLGIKVVPNPRHADALLITGPLTRQTRMAIKKAYEAMPPKPRIVVAIGTCACSGGIFYNSYALYNTSPERGRDRLRSGGIEMVVPVDMYIPGCPPSPEEILYGLAQLLGIKEKRMKGEHWKALPPGEEGKAENEVEFTIPERGISLRLWLTLREELRRIVGYFDREAVLNEFIKLVEEAEKSENPKDKLHELVSEYVLREGDSRIRVAMMFLENEYWRLKDEYERRKVGLAKAKVL
ncbi:NADH-quinone oxidoreductase subunit B family protein [Pyrococcus abyssi]|uniref:Hydrogenase 4, component I or formate hydrogen lyase, subunit 7 n=1 Tax=Pyrococcus abyssi (strain GE5 / Orsay) TaxID=272844 RepID=Q9UYN6_PYRAB|nr:NADH-quinone oxidoreductase subunit B family protein [Pyrococcus abyssi]CAB50376.1 Hydrogenase 4, component I or formate hydrogen lyase, subunit 7 [Pyrococcus abyssi GE5]CCE70923.1 TPA: hydrogenase-4 component i [Pyrococcus abyssi GE5]